MGLLKGSLNDKIDNYGRIYIDYGLLRESLTERDLPEQPASPVQS